MWNITQIRTFITQIIVQFQWKRHSHTSTPTAHTRLNAHSISVFGCNHFQMKNYITTSHSIGDVFCPHQLHQHHHHRRLTPYEQRAHSNIPQTHRVIVSPLVLLCLCDFRKALIIIASVAFILLFFLLLRPCPAQNGEKGFFPHSTLVVRISVIFRNGNAILFVFLHE